MCLGNPKPPKILTIPSPPPPADTAVQADRLEIAAVDGGAGTQGKARAASDLRSSLYLPYIPR